MPTPSLTPEALLAHWWATSTHPQADEARPEDQQFTFSIGGMRRFGALALEMLGMAEPMVRGTVTNQ